MVRLKLKFMWPTAMDGRKYEQNKNKYIFAFEGEKEYL